MVAPSWRFDDSELNIYRITSHFVSPKLSSISLSFNKEIKNYNSSMNPSSKIRAPPCEMGVSKFGVRKADMTHLI